MLQKSYIFGGISFRLVHLKKMTSWRILFSVQYYKISRLLPKAINWINTPKYATNGFSNWVLEQKNKYSFRDINDNDLNYILNLF